MAEEKSLSTMHEERLAVHLKLYPHIGDIISKASLGYPFYHLFKGSCVKRLNPDAVL